MIKKLAVSLLAFALVISSFAGCAKVVKIGEEGELTGETTFNAGDSVDQMWASKAVPELTKEAVDLKTLLTEANGNLSSVAKKYGKYSSGTSGEVNYIVKGTGNVTSVDQQKKAGTMKISLDGYSGKQTIEIQIGPVYMGTSVRDSLSFIKYEDYKNQVQWAQISQSINKVIQKEVVDPADPASLKGKTIEFTGCFTAGDDTEIRITPVQIKAK